MAVANCDWIEKDILGEGPCARQGASVAVSGDHAFLFGGSTTYIFRGKETTIYHSDLYKLTVEKSRVYWEKVQQRGKIPSGREGLTLCACDGVLYLYGGKDSSDARECLPGLHAFSTESQKWEHVVTRGEPPRTLDHTLSCVGDVLYVFGGYYDGAATNKTHILPLQPPHVWTPLATSGILPSPRCDHASAVVGDQLFIFGGCGGDTVYYKDCYSFNTTTLSWKKLKLKGDAPVSRGGHTFTAHKGRSIYIFGGFNDAKPGMSEFSAFSDLHKLSLKKMKWKKPIYTGLPAERRFGHVSWVLHNCLYIHGGMGVAGELASTAILRLTHPADRKPLLAEDLVKAVETGESDAARAELDRDSGLAFELEHPPFSRPVLPSYSNRPVEEQQQTVAGLLEVRDQAVQSIDKAVQLLAQKFAALDRERVELQIARAALEQERASYKLLYQQQQQELQDTLERSRDSAEQWYRERCQKTDLQKQALAKQKQSLDMERKQLTQMQSVLTHKNTKHAGVGTGAK